MADQLGQQVSAVLSEETQRLSGDEAVSMNIAAGAAVADTVRSTLGPRGMDKMLVSEAGDVVVTNDGVTVLEEMDVDHPAAHMVIDVAETQESEVGDGTTTAVIVAGKLLDEAQDLMDRGVHPTTVIGGYEYASSVVDDLLDDLTVEVSADDTELLERVAETAMTGKGAESAKDVLVPMVVEAVRETIVDGEVDIDAVKLEPFTGRTVDDSRLVDGIMVDKEPPHSGMPTDVDDAEFLVYDGDLERQEATADAEIEVSSTEELDAFVEHEREELDEMARGVIEAGVDAVFVTGGIDDAVQAKLADAGILAIRRMNDSDVEKLVRSSDASRVTELADVSGDDLGHAGTIHQERIAGVYGPKSAAPEESLVVNDLPETNAVSLLLRGGTDHVLDEIERAIDDALRAVAVTLDEGVVVPGGGATEVALSRGFRQSAESLGGRGQLAAEAVADAVEVVPRTLATNSGMNPVDAIVDIRAEQDGGVDAAGIDGHEATIADMHEAGVVEPRKVKEQAIKAGIETVNTILRIDDVLSVGDLAAGDDDEEEAGGPPGGGMGGMGGMGGGMGGMM